jgi:hypothetical protein
MHFRFALRAGAVAVCCLAFAAASRAAVLHQFTTTDSNVPAGDDGYDPAAVTVVTGPNVSAPATGAAVQSGATGLVRFWNTEWAGFSLSSNNGPAIDNATEFAGGYLTWTVAAQPGYQLNLSSLDLNSARGGGDPATQTRGFRLYAEANGGTFDLADATVLTVANETGTRAAPVARSADLSGAAFQGVNSITFRYYPLTPANGNTMDFSGMTLNGEAVVPEPASLGLVACGAALVLRRRRA